MASPAQALTEEQRQQIISTLLAERRSRNCAAERKPHTQQQDRAARVQELLQQRAVARQQQGYADPQEQQQPHCYSPPSNAVLPHLQQHLHQQASLDDLLSPGSTCSVASSKQLPRFGQQQHMRRVSSPHGVNRSNNLSSSTVGAIGQCTARSDVETAFEYADDTLLKRMQQQPAQQQFQYQQQQQLQQQPAQHSATQQPPTQQHQYQYQRQQQQQPARIAPAVTGPVDVSQLWATDADDVTPSEQCSYDAYGDDAEDEYCDSRSPSPCSFISKVDAVIHTRGKQKQQQAWQQLQPQQLHMQTHEQLTRPKQQSQVQQREQQHLQRRQQQIQRQRQQKQQQEQPQRREPTPGRHRRASLPYGYPASAEERLKQLSQPKAVNREKYERIKQSAEQELLQACSFRPRTGRGPQHATAHQGLPVSERLYHTAAERQAKLARKAAQAEASRTQGCTFRPKTNAAAQERYLASYEYVPIHERLGEVLRSKNEKLAAIQMRVEKESSDAAPFMPRINPRSSVLALRASRYGAAAGSRDDGDGSDQTPGRAMSRSRGLRRSRSEAELAAKQQECTFTPRINASSKALLHASGEIPRDFLQRQEYFDRLAREKKQLLALAVEDQHCCFSPTGNVSEYGYSSGSLDGSAFLDRIERLAYQDKRAQEAARSVLAEQMHNAECTFKPAINPRSQRIAKATPLHELYENSKGKMKRGAVALAVELQHKQECTFTPNLQKPGVPMASPPEAKLSLSASEVDAVVERLHSHQRCKEDKVEAALSFKQYQELKQCTFTPEITREVPRQQGPVLVRGLGRFMELKEMARKQQEEKAAVEAKVFMTQLKPVRNRITMPEPFNLGRGIAGVEAQLRRSQAEALALQAATRECTFKPQINSSHQSRQQRVQQLLEGNSSSSSSSDSRSREG